MSELKVGAKVIYAGPKVTTEEAADDILTYGYTESMADFVFKGKPAVIGSIRTSSGEISHSTIEINGYAYAPHEVKLINTLPVKNRPAYAVVKNKEVLGMFELRADARKAKKSIGGKKAGVIIVAYAPVEEIR